MTADLKQRELKDIEKVCGNLMQSNSEEFRVTVIYLVYQTIVANPSITSAQLQWLLGVKFFLQPEAVLSAVAQLCNPEGFNTVTRWSNPSAAGKVILLTAKEPSPDHFQLWIMTATKSFPEIMSIVPPIYQSKRDSKDSKSTRA